MRVMGVDPGKTSGFWVYDGVANRFEATDHHGQVTLDALPARLVFMRETGLLDSLDVIVIEDFALLGGKALAQIGSKFETCQSIGMFKLWAFEGGKTVVLQPPRIKPIAVKWSHIKVPSDHRLSHRFDAALHAVYYLVDQCGYYPIREE